MRTFVSICRVLVWTVLVLTTLIQIGAILSISLGERLVNPTLLTVATALMLLSVIVFFALRHGKVFPLITAAVAGILFIIAALELKDTLSVVVTERGLAGISLWTAMYRHMSPALIPFLMLPIFWDDYTDRRAAKLAEADRVTPTFFETTEEEVAPIKQKRSVRARIRKTEVTGDSSNDI